MSVQRRTLRALAPLDPFGQLRRRERPRPGGLDRVALGLVRSRDENFRRRRRLHRELLDEIVGGHAAGRVEHGESRVWRRPLDGDFGTPAVEDDTHADALEIVKHAQTLNQPDAGDLAPLFHQHSAQIWPSVRDVVAVHEQVFGKLHNACDSAQRGKRGNLGVRTNGPVTPPRASFRSHAGAGRNSLVPMNRQTRLAVRLLAVGVIVVGAVVLLPHVLDGVAILLNAIRRNWWLVVLVALAVWGLLASGKKR